MLKKLGRINSILNEDLSKQSANMLISGEILKIYFDGSIDLGLIKENLTKKQSKIKLDLEVISKKLNNPSFIDRAPKHIVEQEKNNYNDIKVTLDKINLTIQSLK